MTMICFDAEHICFNYRVAGIALRNDQVLLQHSEGQDFWFLLGGRVEMGEAAGEALRREMQEELEETVQVGRLVWVAENFFRDESKGYHELGFYYRMDFAPDSPILRADTQFFGQEGKKRIVFQWFSLNELDKVTLYPTFLVEGLCLLPQQTTHVLVDDNNPLRNILH